VLFRYVFGGAISTGGVTYVNFLVAGILVQTAAFGALTTSLFIPIDITVMGHDRAPNAEKYGWGYFPHESVAVIDPDTGEVYRSNTNSSGWRDKEHSERNANSAFRILLLGDSNTFGATVRFSETYGQLLERILTGRGYRVEVIQLAHGGWSTDQELEALKLEGLKYKPDLIILQFCTNDLFENVSWTQGDPSDPRSLAALKPFHYVLSEKGLLERRSHQVRIFEFSDIAGRLRRSLYRLELWKRSAALLGKRPAGPKLDQENREQREVIRSYSTTPAQEVRLKRVTNGRQLPHVFALLSANPGGDLEEGLLREAISLDRANDLTDTVLRILEKQWFQRDGESEAEYVSGLKLPHFPDSMEWRLFEALLGEMARVAKSRGASLLLFNETETGWYDWNVSWHKFKPGEETKSGTLAHIDHLKQIARRAGAQLIENRRVYVRSRNDPHPNEAGNLAMAEDIAESILASHRQGLESHRIGLGISEDR
jgi:lysophospholipase L1-like esterase